MVSQGSNCLVVGAGYVGTRLALELCRKNMNVSALKRSAPDKNDRNNAINWIKGCASTWKPTQSYDLIAYCISADGYTEDAYKKAYFETLKTVASWQPNKGHLIVLSSTSGYTQKSGESVDESCIQLADSGPSSWIVRGENAALATHKKVSVLRLGGIYGPGRDRLIRKVRSQESIPKSEAWSNRIHRDDAAKAIVHLYEHGLAGVYNCTDMSPTPLHQIYEWIAGELNTHVHWSEPQAGSPLRGNKKVSSAKLENSGFVWTYPDYKRGFTEALGKKR